MIKMNSQRFYPYGLRSLKECIFRATLLSQPADIPNFLSEYMSELLLFRDSSHEIDPKLLSFNFQELYEKHFFRYLTERNKTTEVKKALETLFSDLTSGNEENVEQKSAAPETVSVATVHPTDLKQTHPPGVKKDTTSSIRIPHHEESTGAIEETAQIDKKPYPSSPHPRPTPPSPKTRPTEKVVPLSSSVLTGHVKSVPPSNGISKKFSRWQDSGRILRPTKTHQPMSSTSQPVLSSQSSVPTCPNHAAPKRPNHAAPTRPNQVAPKRPNHAAPTRPNQVAPKRPNHAAPVLLQKPVLPPIPTPVPLVSKLTTRKDKKQENTRPQPLTSKDREPEKSRTESVTEGVTRQETIRTMPKTLKDRKPDRTRTQLSPRRGASSLEGEAELNRRLMKRTRPTTTEVTGLEKTKTQTRTKTECMDRKTESTLAKVYKPKVPNQEKTKTRPTKPKPDWNFEHLKSSKVPLSVRTGRWSDIHGSWSGIHGQGSDRPGQGSYKPGSRPVVNKVLDKSYTVSFGTQRCGPQGLNSLDMTQFTYSYHNCPHLAQPVHVISRIRLRAQPST
ncbi:hypothetical protein Q8A73_005113 [Channa argus]|nr:hypothetical protein Q8A73_005113 [Channa argus]